MTTNLFVIDNVKQKHILQDGHAKLTFMRMICIGYQWSQI